MKDTIPNPYQWFADFFGEKFTELSERIDKRIEILQAKKPTEKRLVTKEETAEILAVSAGTVDNLVKKGCLEKYNPTGTGGKACFYLPQVMEYLESTKV